MALVVADMVVETSTSTGTGAYALAGAPTGYQAFSVIGAGNTAPYRATDGTNWEVGIGTWTSGPSTLARTTILASSNAGAAVNWGSGTKKIACTLPASLAGLERPAIKNKIIGGDFGVNPWQRGTSFTNPNWVTADCWRVANTGGGAVDILKTADAPTAAEAGLYTGYCFHADVTTADASVAAGDAYLIQHRIEGINAAAYGFGQTGTRYVTLSFWVKSVSGTHCVGLSNSASNRSYVLEYTVSVANTWEFKTLTFPVDTTGTWLYDTGIGMIVNWTLMAGSTYQTTAGSWAAGNYIATSSQVNVLASTANNFKLALVQIEAGQVASPFEARDAGTELILARRYLPAFFSSSTASALGTGQAYSATAALVYRHFDVPARTAPTGITASGAGHLSLLQANTTVSAATGITFHSHTNRYIGSLDVTGVSGMVAGNAAQCIFNNASGYILFTGAEL